MSEAKDRISSVGSFFRLLKHAPKSQYLAFENLITGGWRWHIRAWQMERRLERATENQFEAGGDDFNDGYEAWLALDYQARFGSPLSKAGRKAVRQLVDSGVPEPEIRKWIANEHMDKDGILKPRYRKTADKIVRSLAWIWHGLVVTSAVFFIVYIWSLPGPIWKKVATSIGIIFFFLIMSALMNSTSLSALPPCSKARDRTSV